MALRTDALGYETEPLEHSYEWQDVVLYNLAIGATRDDELPLLWEGKDGNGPVVFPTYGVIPAWPAMVELFEAVGGDMLGVVHGAQRIRCHAPFKPSGTVRTVGRVAGVYDLKRLAQALFVSETRDEDGTLLSETEWSVVFRFDGGFGGPKPPRWPKARLPEGEPTFEVREATTTQQALLYRLTGDHNPLHADPEIGEKAGFGQPILHGLCTFGYVARHLIRGAAGGDVSKLMSLEGQFRKPVWPGDTLCTKAFIDETIEASDAERHYVLEMRTEERPDEIPFANARAVFRAE